MKTNLLISFILTCALTLTAMAQSAVPQIIYPQEANPQGSKIALVQGLPQGEWPVILAGVVRIALGITGSLALVAFTVGGVMFVTAQGNEEKISKAKNIILWSLLALLVIAASYAIVLGITQLEFFQ